MARGDLLCPVDGLILGLPTMTVRQGQDPARLAVGDHVHLAVTGTLACANGHTFAVRDDLLLTRTA